MYIETRCYMCDDGRPPPKPPMSKSEWSKMDRERMAEARRDADRRAAADLLDMARLGDRFDAWKAKLVTVGVVFSLSVAQRRELMAWAWPRSLLREDVRRLMRDIELGLLS